MDTTFTGVWTCKELAGSDEPCLVVVQWALKYKLPKPGKRKRSEAGSGRCAQETPCTQAYL